MRFGSGEFKEDMGRRLFQGFQQGVEGRLGQHVYFINDVNFVGAVGRHELDVAAQLPDLIDAVVGGPVDFVNVGGVAGGDLQA